MRLGKVRFTSHTCLCTTTHRRARTHTHAVLAHTCTFEISFITKHSCLDIEHIGTHMDTHQLCGSHTHTHTHTTVAGIKPAKLVEAHGSFSTASCIRCESKQDPEEVKVQLHVYYMSVCVIVGNVFLTSLIPNPPSSFLSLSARKTWC